MKYFSFLAVIFLFSCHGQYVPHSTILNNYGQIGDSVVLLSQSPAPRAETPILAPMPPADSCKRLIDSLRTQLTLAKFKIEQVRFYVQIVKKSPKNLKFLVGWLSNRVLK